MPVSAAPRTPASPSPGLESTTTQTRATAPPTCKDAPTRAPTPSPIPFAEPPTRESLSSARLLLKSKRLSIQALSTQIQTAQNALAQLIADSQQAIAELQDEREKLKKDEDATLGYLSPVRRVPAELVREIFGRCFERYPCCAWVLAAVCRRWRREALKMPRIWSKIRLLTTPSSSADTIRLWLERSGTATPLDIEIVLRVGPPPNSRRRHQRDDSNDETPHFDAPSQNDGAHIGRRKRKGNHPAWATSFTTLGLSHTAPQTSPSSIGSPSVGVGHGTMPPSLDPWNVQQHQQPGYFQHPFSSHDRAAMERALGKRRAKDFAAMNMQQHWGHVAFFYLMQQMHRWERFIFRFDRQFMSMGALKSINGYAPLLKEFEVSSAEAGFYAEWPWLPNTPANPHTARPASPTPLLTRLTLIHTPFTHSSSIFQSNLTHLTLRATPTSHFALDRILGLIRACPELEVLRVWFQGVLPPVLPMTVVTPSAAVANFTPPSANPSNSNAPGSSAGASTNLAGYFVTLPSLHTLAVGGHFLLTRLIDALMLPALERLSLDIEARTPIEETLLGLVRRSGCANGLRALSVGFGLGGGVGFPSGFGGIDDGQEEEGDFDGWGVSSAGYEVLGSGGLGPGGMPVMSGGPGHGGGGGGGGGFYFGPAVSILNWNLLREFPHLKSLSVGGAPLENVLSALGRPGDNDDDDDDDNQTHTHPQLLGANATTPASGGWVCRELESLRLRGGHCHGHSAGVGRLVALVNARNPHPAISTSAQNGQGSSNLPVKRLKRLEVVDCGLGAGVGGDVLGWLKARVERVQVQGGEEPSESSATHHPFL